ncbi:TPM domain-containing protein [bacterium]|nr:MAG: TPM domain-containing protein [bacterium]
MEELMKRIAALAAVCAMLLAGLAAPALARASYVQDGAGIFSSATVSSLNAEIGNFSAATGKEVVVVTVPSLNGTALSAAAESTFAQQSVNGVLIFIAKAEHSDYIVGDRAAHGIFPPGAIAHVRDAMNASFRQGDFDGGATSAINLILDTYRSHPASGSGARSAPYGAPSVPAANTGTQGGLHVGFLWWILIIIAIFWVVRSVLRSAGGYANPGSGPGYGAHGGGGPGYGSGMGWGGGGFWSGLLGGLGGAFLGNELFGQHNQGTIGTAGTFGEPGAGNTDSGAYQPDAGQPDMGGASGGSWGDPGGGWGGGDPGGGWGGGDAGGGWGGGDSGGGGW